MSKAIIRNGRIYYDTAAEVIKPTETAARASREDQRVRYRKDILQKNQVDYWKVHKDQAAELNPELRRLLS